MIVSTAPTGSAQFGTEKSPGTKVVSVSGNVRRPGNYEVELGIPAREIIYDLAGGPYPGTRVKAWFPGGSSAPVLTEEHLDLPVRLREHGRRPARCSARARSSSSTRPCRSCRSRCGSPSSTATSPAASACPAARARTGR